MSLTVESRVVLTCELTEAEQDLCATMRQMTGITSEANLVRLGLYHLARHLDVPVGEHFHQRTRASAANGQKRHGVASRIVQRELTEQEQV